MDNSKVLIAVVAGAAAGALVALLLAPESGADLRNKLAEGAKKFTDDLKTQLQDGVGAFGKVKDQARQYANENSSANM